jgi:hypothetical protein
MPPADSRSARGSPGVAVPPDGKPERSEIRQQGGVAGRSLWHERPLCRGREVPADSRREERQNRIDRATGRRPESHPSEVDG